MFLKKCLIIIVSLNELINVFIYNIRIIKLIGWLVKNGWISFKIIWKIKIFVK